MTGISEWSVRKRAGAALLAAALALFLSIAPARALTPWQVHQMAIGHVKKALDAAIKAIDQEIAQELSGATQAFTANNNAGVAGKLGDEFGGDKSAREVRDAVDDRIRTEAGPGLSGNADIPDDPEDIPGYEFMAPTRRAVIDELYELRDDTADRLSRLNKARAALKKASDAYGAQLNATRGETGLSGEETGLYTPIENRAEGALALSDNSMFGRVGVQMDLVHGYIRPQIWNQAFDGDGQIHYPIKLGLPSFYFPRWVIGPDGAVESFSHPDDWEAFLYFVWDDYGERAVRFYEAMETSLTWFEGEPKVAPYAEAIKFNTRIGLDWHHDTLPRLWPRDGGTGGTLSWDFATPAYGDQVLTTGVMFGGAPLQNPSKENFTTGYFLKEGLDFEKDTLKISPIGKYWFFPTFLATVRVNSGAIMESGDDGAGGNLWSDMWLDLDYKVSENAVIRFGTSIDPRLDERDHSTDHYPMDGAIGSRIDLRAGGDSARSFDIGAGYSWDTKSYTAPIVLNDPLARSRGSWGQDYGDQWALEAIGLDAAAMASLPEKATPVTVAVIDTGVDAYHPELIGALWRNPNEIPWNGKDDDKNGFVDDLHGWNFIDENTDTRDLNGHGTAVAGIIAAWPGNRAGIAGINPWARIMPLKVADHKGEGSSIRIARAIHYAADNGARVINISSVIGRLSRVVYQAVLYARRRGAIVVAAAGNDGKSVANVSPAALPGVITVTAMRPDGKRAGYSNRGRELEIAAPGIDILSLRARRTDLMRYLEGDYEPGAAFVGDDKRYYRVSGTSFAAPFVSGVASLLFSLDPKRTPGQVKRMILHSARDVGVPGYDRFSGYGALDARAALRADPDYYVIARIDSLKPVERNGSRFLEPTGSATADKFKRAWLEVGQGKAPRKWVRVQGTIAAPFANLGLGLIPAAHFTGRGAWTVRLLVEHENGSRREARFALDLE